MRKELITYESPKSNISEIFRTLRTNIQFMNNKNKLQTLLITSTSPREGKSWISANLAVTFAQAGKKVILIDSDMRKGRQYSIFSIAPTPGLSNYLSDFNELDGKIQLLDYIKETKVEGLYLMPAGNVPPNPSELLVSEAMINLIEQLKQLADIVILDGPPTQLVTDPLILARLVDSTVVVTASNQTKKDDLRRIVDNIQKVGGKIAGIVVNKLSISSKKYQESYYYNTNISLIETKNKKMPSLNKKTKNDIFNVEINNKINENSQNNEISENNESNENIETIKNQENISIEKTLEQMKQYIEQEKN